jgi:glucosylceramidase
MKSQAANHLVQSTIAPPSESFTVEWFATTQTSQWQTMNRPAVWSALESRWDVEAQLDTPLQTIDGFGACFNELGWTSLSALDDSDKESILHELFAPGVGANFSLCRMPIGANDFSLDWYSYD